MTSLQAVKTKVDEVVRGLQLVWSACRGLTLLWAVLLVALGLLPAATVQLTRVLVDTLVAGLGSSPSWSAFEPIVLSAGLMAATLLLSQMLQLAAEWVRAKQAELVQDHIARLVQDKCISVDMGFYEMPTFYDHLHRARADATTRPLALLESFGSLLQNGITLTAMGAVLLPYGWWLPPALLLSTIPAFYVVLTSSRRYHQWSNETTVGRRRTQYLDSLLTEPYSAGEVRMFDISRHLQSAYQRLRRQYRTERLTLLKQQYLSRLGAELLAVAISGVALLWMLYRAFLGVISLGDLALFYQAFQRGQTLVRTLLSNLGQIYSNSLYLTNLFEFLSLQGSIVDAPDAVPAPERVRSGIRFTNVSFRYPGRTANTLTDFNGFFPAGKIIALVGENGAGKTTLLKLIARLYDPQSGRVQLDGIDTRQIALRSLRTRVGFMFQAPVYYDMTAKENIALGNIEAAADMDRIERAAASAGAHTLIGQLPSGYDTMLGCFFPDGRELSRGEWQRIALARAFMRDAEILLLDEPTSAMDPWAETDWYDRVRVLAEGRTLILATHRPSIARRADLIYVLKRGAIVEAGSPEELLARGGVFAESFEPSFDVPELQTAAS